MSDQRGTDWKDRAIVGGVIVGVAVCCAAIINSLAINHPTPATLSLEQYAALQQTAAQCEPVIITHKPAPEPPSLGRAMNDLAHVINAAETVMRFHAIAIQDALAHQARSANEEAQEWRQLIVDSAGDKYAEQYQRRRALAEALELIKAARE